MWIDKDDIFADDKVREFKLSNPDAETHIRSTLTAKSPYPSAPTHSQLLYQHTLSYMSSDGNVDLAYNTLLELSGIPPFLFHKNYQSIPPFLLSTSPPCSPSIPPLPPLFLDLSLPRPRPQTSLPCSGSSESTPPLPSHPTASAPLNKPTKCLLFRSPLPKGDVTVGRP
jgi:hypothetical protein